MFNYEQLEIMKQAALEDEAWEEANFYQNEQILRELKSIGWKMKEAMDRNV